MWCRVPPTAPGCRLHAPPGRPGPEGRQGVLRVTREPPRWVPALPRGHVPGAVVAGRMGPCPCGVSIPAGEGGQGWRGAAVPGQESPRTLAHAGLRQGLPGPGATHPCPCRPLPTVCPPPAAVAGRPAQTVLTSTDGHTFHGHSPPPPRRGPHTPHAGPPPPPVRSVGTRAPSLGDRSPGKLLLDSPGSEPGAGRPASRATGRGIGPHQHAVTRETKKLPLSPGGWNEPVTVRPRVTGEGRCRGPWTA